jgi:broad specificity phosphatase PhoE
MRMPPLRIHFVRHGKVASHRGDIPVTREGLQEVEARGRRLLAELESDEVVAILTTATFRARETAIALYQSTQAALDERAGALSVTILPPAEEPAIRNPDIYVAGRRVEMVSTGEAVAEQIPGSGLGAEDIEKLPFYREFFPHPDRVGYWVGHPDPPGEDADAVARRLLTFGISLLDVPSDRPQRYICVSHSPLLRAFLRRYVLGEDPGEPEFLESVDLLVPGDGSLTMRFREHTVSSTLALRANVRSAASRA